ncbi:hypothetical protein [Gluconobacter kondonii]|nr:hypothetical protein [Gluconobacter kondonii]
MSRRAGRAPFRAAYGAILRQHRAGASVAPLPFPFALGRALAI